MQPTDEQMREANAQGTHQPARRRAPLPVIKFPEDLPVSGAREEIARAIESHQVVIVSGETGSGKTTQLPKICLALGRGSDRLIGHTQPRRIAASSIARRIAAELGSAPGRSRRLQGAVYRSYAARRVDQVDDRRHSARRDAG